MKKENKYRQMQTVYAVLWKDKVRPFYGVPKKDLVITCEAKEEIKTRRNKSVNGKTCYYADPLAIFSLKKEALAYWRNNTDWEVKRITLLI